MKKFTLFSTRKTYIELLTILSKTRNQNTKIGGDKQEPERLESKLRMVERHLTKDNQLQADVAVNDGVHIIFVNGELSDGKTALGRLTHDFKCESKEFLEILNV